MRAVIHINTLSFFASLCVIAGCGYRPPAPPAPRAGTPVNAAVGRTWDAVIELFARRSIPIRTIERASGFVATEELIVSSDASDEYADCGQSPPGTHYRADRASYNVLVRGDSTSSSVLVTTRFLPANNLGFSCVSNGKWEREFEADVKARAEGKPLPITSAVREASDPCRSSDAAERDGDDWRVTLYRSDASSKCVERKKCRYREGALNTSQEDAVERCRAEAKREP